MSASASRPWPTEIRLAPDKRTLAIAYDDGSRFELAAEFLRVMSPSAEVQGHAPSERKTVPGKRNVQILALEPVGNYAVKIVFDDMHQTGLFTWVYLHELGSEFVSLWARYEAELAEQGLSRDPKVRARPS